MSFTSCIIQFIKYIYKHTHMLCLHNIGVKLNVVNQFISKLNYLTVCYIIIMVVFKNVFYIFYVNAMVVGSTVNL